MRASNREIGGLSTGRLSAAKEFSSADAIVSLPLAPAG